MSALLSVAGLEISFGAVHAVRGIDFALAPGSSMALVGTNGAGKSSTLLAIARALEAGARCRGRIEIAQGRSISMVPEREKVFTLLTVTENLVAADRQRGHGRVVIDDVYGWFPQLSERRSSLAGNLSGGEQQMLAIGMALLGSPSILLLDEPTLGLAVPMIERTCEALARLRRELNLTMLCAEADAQWVDRLAERALVIVRGKIVAAIESDLAGRRAEIRDLSLGLRNGMSP